jgi:Flp pilus assembly protein TadD
MDLKQAIRKEPEKYEHYLKLADYYKRAGRLAETHQTLTTALEVSGNDPNVRERFEDTELAQLKENVELAKEKGAAGDEVAKKNAVELDREYHKRKLEILSRRVERHPQDLNLKFELATVFMLFQKWQQAIPLLQQASKNQRLRVPTLVRLGTCFIKDNKLTLAKAQLKRAVEDLDTDDPKLFCDAHYSLGWVCEQLGELADAENHYGEVLVVEYEYKDALQRLEKLQSGGSE